MNKTINDLSVGERAVVVGIGCTGSMRRRLIDLGLTPGADVMVRRIAPLGDPLEVRVRGYELSIRRSEAREIYVVSST